MTSLLFPDCPFHPLFWFRGFVCSSAPVNLALVLPGDVSMAFGSRWAGVIPCHCWGTCGPVVLKSLIRFFKCTYLFCAFVTDLQGPPSERTQMEKLRDLKKLAQQYARDWGSCDDTQISYLEMLEDSADDNLRLAQMISG
jgi:hypothetical protein